MTTAPSCTFRWAVAACCAYEVAAITTARTPTISALCARRRWLIPLIVGGLTVHLVKGPLHHD
jgi:hypothetical protein